jgi:hypothetical protein
MTSQLKISHRIATAAAGALAVAILLSACGSSSPGSSVAHLGSTTNATPSASSSSDPSTPQARYEQAVKFSTCMRSHGMPNFPDPQQHGGGHVTLSIHAGPGTGLDPNSSQFRAAQNACRQYLPPGATNGTVSPQFRAEALAFSACMRTHGVPNFPDPQFHGGDVQIGGPRADLTSPQAQAAQRACQSKLPGATGGPGTSSQSGGSK